MPQAQKILAALLSELARATERITDEQLEKLLSGEARLSVTVRMKKSALNKETPPMSMAERREGFDDARRRR